MHTTHANTYNKFFVGESGCLYILLALRGCVPSRLSPHILLGLASVAEKPSRLCLYILLGLCGWLRSRLCPDILLGLCGWLWSYLCPYILLGLCGGLPRAPVPLHPRGSLWRVAPGTCALTSSWAFVASCGHRRDHHHRPEQRQRQPQHQQRRDQDHKEQKQQQDHREQ